MKKIAALLVPLILIGMFSFGTAAKTRTINVYNWGEYIPDGSDGSLNINELFTEKTGIEVNYVTFASNEEMYAKLASGGVSYDVVIPSDYMIERMIKENMLQKLDFDNIPNYQYIVDRYKSLAYDPDNAYSVPYTVGLVGIIYNTTVVTETPASWDLLWNEKYSDQILMFDNSRDAFAAAQFLLGYDVNTTDVNELNAVAQKLKEQKSLVRKYVMDEIFNMLESGEAAIGPYYAGDYLTMYENNTNLAFYYPEEGTNFFVDAMCIPTCASDKEAAEAYINFLLSPDIALEIAEYICYATPNSSVLENDEYSLKDNKYLYPSDEVLAKTQIFTYLPQETTDLVNDLWNSIAISGTNYTVLYICFGAVLVIVIAVAVFLGIRKKKRSVYEDTDE